MLRAATYWPNLRFHSCKMRLDVPRYRICYTHESTPLVVVAIYDASPCFHAHPLPAVVVVVVAFTPKVHALLTHSTSTNHAHAFAYVASSSSSTRAVRARAPFLARRVLERSRSRSRTRHRSIASSIDARARAKGTKDRSRPRVLGRWARTTRTRANRVLCVRFPYHVRAQAFSGSRSLES